MQKPQVKGELFIKTYAFIMKKWGTDRAKKIGLDTSFYRPEQTGDFKGSSEGSNTLSVYTNIWTQDDKVADIWSEFYRGRSQGVLDLTGRRGKVEKVMDLSGSEKAVTYEIRWF